MDIVNVEGIIYGTPEKRFLLAYNKMKDNYNEASADEFKDTYDKEPLSLILENSDKVFSEPYFGLDFYKKSLMENCAFTAVESEVDKVEQFVESHKEQMSNKQRALYESSLQELKEFSKKTKGTQLMASYIKEHIDPDFEDNLSGVLYKYYESPECDEKVMSVMESIDNPMVYFTYAPYVYEKTGNIKVVKMSEVFCESSAFDPENMTEETWKNFVNAVVSCNKLGSDTGYMEAVGGIHNMDYRDIFNYFIEASIDEALTEMTTEHVDESILTENSVEAVNNIFLDMYEAAIDDINGNDIKKKNDMFTAIALETTMDILYEDYITAESTDDSASSYSFFGKNSNMTLAQACDMVNKKYADMYKAYTEATTSEDDDFDDEDLEEDDDEDGPRQTEVDNNSKPVAPKSGSVATNIQNKAMDKEAKYYKKSAERHVKGERIKGAAKAVTAVPRNMVSRLQAEVRKFDQMDDERRKNYMIKPGFRKKAFRKLKLAIMYGSAASIKLSLIIPLAICRHFSKEKDRRMRTELLHELETQIEVTNAKIADAEGRDRNEMYHLIRVRSQLNKEKTRILTNSKYI